MLSNDKYSGSVRAVFFSHFNAGKFDSTVALLGKGAANCESSMINGVHNTFYEYYIGSQINENQNLEKKIKNCKLKSKSVYFYQNR